MDAILQKFAGKIDAQSLVRTVEELRVEYIDDGLTKEDVPPILGRLMMESVKFKKLPGPHKKKLVIAVLNHLIEEIDEGEKDSEFEIILKSLVPPMVDSFAAMLKANKAIASCFSCLAQGK
jgi:hypothetical protein|tara:strand:- start:329 stop:691 length:363 start_codon:yes stop_codon:yes gene_type:complete